MCEFIFIYIYKLSEFYRNPSRFPVRVSIFNSSRASYVNKLIYETKKRCSMCLYSLRWFFFHLGLIKPLYCYSTKPGADQLLLA